MVMSYNSLVTGPLVNQGISCTRVSIALVISSNTGKRGSWERAEDAVMLII
jgi:hypothetical protein